jgi:hypothetical protein
VCWLDLGWAWVVFNYNLGISFFSIVSFEPL